MKNFYKDLEVGEIHLRDRWQFELKSEYFPFPNLKTNSYTQEFYFFIPSALQINEETYSRKNFYQDLTNFIRFKTPEFKLDEILDKENKRSPLARVFELAEKKNKKQINHELKLLGNVVRSSIREHSREILEIHESGDISELKKRCLELCQHLKELRRAYDRIYKEPPFEPFRYHIAYVDEFISSSIHFYLIGLLNTIRKTKSLSGSEVDDAFCEVLASEKSHREKELAEPGEIPEEEEKKEFVLYRKSLLNKFVLDALLLPTSRESILKRYRNLIGSVSAGIAMLFFFLLFVWQGQVFVINSVPFILLTVFLYILKDRIKEGLRKTSYRQFSKWFPDFKTEIQSPDRSCSIGEMTESFSLLKEKNLPSSIVMMRNQGFHDVMEEFHRPETAIYYKKKVQLFGSAIHEDSRRNSLNMILRLNIAKFIRKADDPTSSYLTIDSKNHQFVKFYLPKVYHINMILINTFTKKDGTEKSKVKKYRLIVDKNGIKRVEYL